MVDNNNYQPERQALLDNDQHISNNSKLSSNPKKYVPTPQDTRESRASYTGSAMINPISKQSRTGAGAQRTSRTAQKLKLLPEEPFQRDDEGLTDLKNQEVYSQVNRIKDKPARRDAEKLGKAHRHLLPRSTAYCTSSSYNMKELIRWLKDCRKIHHTHPKLFDECLYTPFIYNDWRGDKRFEHEDVIRLDDEGGEIIVSDKHPDLFIFEYGVVVMWGFTEREEKAFLNDIEKFEKEKLIQFRLLYLTIIIKLLEFI